MNGKTRRRMLFDVTRLISWQNRSNVRLPIGETTLFNGDIAGNLTSEFHNTGNYDLKL